MTSSSQTTGQLRHVTLDAGWELTGRDASLPNRDFYLYTPIKAHDKKPSAIVLMLHGRGGNGRGTAIRYGWCELADEAGFICAFPQALRLKPDKPERFLDNPRVWNDGFKRDPDVVNNNDTDYLAQVIHQAQKSLGHDGRNTPLPVFMTGFSNGASMAFGFAMSRPDLVQAIAPVCGYCPQQQATAASNRDVADKGSGAAIETVKPSTAPDCFFVMGGSDPINPAAGGSGRNLWGSAMARPSAADSIAAWLKSAQPQPASTRPGPGGADMQRFESGRHKLDYLLVPGLGHTWPGSREVLPQEAIGPTVDGLDLTREVWSFFQKQMIETD